MHLRGLDLNLLIALDALLTERNVTRAAERINISQPGMSAALQKLRDYFGDQLLERIGRNLELTAKARALSEPVKDVLTRISNLAQDTATFEASAARRVFRISATTYGCEILATPLISRLQETAPLVSVLFEELSADTADRLRNGATDFAITISARLLAKLQADEEWLRSEKLFADTFVVAISKGHALASSTLTLDDLCELGYVETRFSGDVVGVAELLWRLQPRQPHICGWLPNFQLTLDTVGRTSMVAVLPSLLVAMHGDRYNVRPLPVPFEMPILEERLYWHTRNESDVGHVWMRRTIEHVAASLGFANRCDAGEPRRL